VVSASVDWARVPVVVGGGQVTNRETDPSRAPNPFDLMVDAARQALSQSRLGATAGPGDTGDGGGALTHVWMVHSLSLRHGDPASELAARLGVPDAEARCSGMGGSVPQWLVNRAADLVASGARPVVLIAGAEALATRRRAKAAGVTLEWPRAPGWPDTWPPLEADLGIHAVERANGLDQATTMYALVETALAHRDGDGPGAHRERVGRLMARLNAVAAENPVSWFPTQRDAEELTTVTEQNRMVAYPYPKYLNAVMDVDMGAAVIVTDAATARGAGLAPDEVAYVRGWADAHDVWYLSQRPDVSRAPGLAACGQAALDQAGLAVSDVGAFDLYSCFPSSVEAACEALGMSTDDPRPLTLTGGLPYHGGPGSNYVTHAVANTLAWLRRSGTGDGDAAVVHGNGYYLTKHSVGVYANRAPSSAPTPDPGLQARIDADGAELALEASASGPGTIAAYTVAYRRDGQRAPGVAVVDLDGDGPRRTLARMDEALTAALVAADDGVGTTVSVTPDGDANTATAR
jgi:acetyl-CoA C-acetyltransferase